MYFAERLLTKTHDAATVQVFNAIADGRITPLYHKDILKEYKEVLSRPKFKFSRSVVKIVLDSIVECGVEVFPNHALGKLKDGMNDGKIV